jgi:cell division protein FtsB
MLEDLARKFGLLALLFALFLGVFLSENGVLEYLKLKRQIGLSESSTARLQDDNIRLKSKIERLQKDDRYLEEVARERYGFIKEGEKLYRIEK